MSPEERDELIARRFGAPPRPEPPRRRRRNVYAYLCAGCNHLATRHGLVRDGDLTDLSIVDGPYQCDLCDCQIRQDAPMHELSRQQYERLPANERHQDTS